MVWRAALGGRGVDFMSYRHTQYGWVLMGICGALLLFFAVMPLPARAPREVVFVVPALVLLVVLALMGSLTVEVDDRSIRLRYGLGLVRKTFPLDEVAGCEPVRNAWWWGWGIRRFPGGWLYNVSGLDAVELRMKNGKRYRIGTDEPRRLSEFLQAKLDRTV